MPLTERLIQGLPPVGVISPISQAAGTVLTGAIDMKLNKRAYFILATGVLGASATVDFSVVGDTASGGSYATTITSTAITQIVKASGDNVLVTVEVGAEAVGAQGLRYIKGRLVVGTAASLVTVLALGDATSYAPGLGSTLAQSLAV